jgi:hypothetical protein
MQENEKVYCPDCEDITRVSRREFMRFASLAAAAGAVTIPAVARAADAPAPARTEKPAEALIKELFSTMTDEQKKELALPFDHTTKGLTRLGMYNGAVMGKTVKKYTKPQQDLLLKIVKAISSGEEGFDKISRNGKWDNSGSFDNCGAIIFGNANDKDKFSFLFTGHHLTLRCDGNSDTGEAFGGPMYYGHSPNGYSPNNVWFYQTKSVISVYEMLDGKQREKAELRGSPGEDAPSVQFREQHPGLTVSDLSADQKKLVETVMRDVLSPYRKEDADNVMNIVKKNGGMEKIHLAFYKDMGMNDNMRWHFWRLEGPNFVWNYRVLPHVHTFVHIAPVKA